jgi:type IV pilus assembly protein PilW
MLMASRRRSRGFTLVEMMVAMVLGIILTGAVTGLVVSTMSTTNSTVQNMRVTEESRAVTEIMTRELRRARYDASAISRVGTGSTGATFAAITPSTVNVASDCIKYSYDVNGDGDATGDTGEFRMFSRDTVGSRGVIRFGKFDTAGAVSCTGGSIITSDDIDVTCLRFISASSNTAMDSNSAAACFNPTPATVATLPTIPAGTLYFASNMSLQTSGTTTARRRADAMIMIRSLSVGP